MGSSMLLQLPAWLKRIRLSMLRWVFDLTVDPWLWNFIQWFEKEDVKGKELSVNAVLDLNPEFRLADEPAQSVSRSVREASQSNIARKSILIPSSKARLKKENIQPSSQSRISVASHSQSRIAKPSSSSSATGPKTGLSRKSEAVRAVEKIERDRVDRRENQQKARYQRDQQRSKHDVNDKQWEFAQMIDDWKADNELQDRFNNIFDFRFQTGSDFCQPN